MATQTLKTVAKPQGDTAGPVPYRLSVRQFEAMIDRGIFGEGDRVELLGGVLCAVMTRNLPHNFAVTRPGGSLTEVSDTTYGTDRGVKWHGHAAARVPAYWILNLSARAVEVYTKPTGRGAAARYRQAETFGPGGRVPVDLAGRRVGGTAVSDVLP